jgi:hypothetical protein
MENPGPGGGRRTLSEIAKRIVDGNRIRWQELFALFISGVFLWVAGLLSAFISGVYTALARGVSWAIEFIYDIWALVPESQAWIVREAFDAASESLSEFGPLAFIVGVGLVIAWFVALESIIAFLRGWLG